MVLTRIIVYIEKKGTCDMNNDTFGLIITIGFLLLVIILIKAGLL